MQEKDRGDIVVVTCFMSCADLSYLKVEMNEMETNLCVVTVTVMILDSVYPMCPGWISNFVKSCYALVYHIQKFSY
jgi:hypothetical protein